MRSDEGNTQTAESMPDDRKSGTAADVATHLITEDAAIYALKLTARGRRDCGRPVSTETARQIARETLVAIGENW
jgi:hypothetical protein